MHRGCLLVLLVLTLAACAGEATSTTSATGEVTTTTTSATTTTTTATNTTAAGTTTTTEPGIDVEIRNGEISGPDRFQFRRGEAVNISVVSDTAYELHVHGYDFRYDLEPEVPFTIEFTADVPGIFEVETHPDHLLVFEIEVSS